MNEKCDTDRDVVGASSPQSTAGPEYLNTGEFGWAVRQLWRQKKVFRKGWNGKGLHLSLQMPDFGSKMSLPYIYMKTSDNQLIPWVATQGDLLSNDWQVLRE